MVISIREFRISITTKNSDNTYQFYGGNYQQVTNRKAQLKNKERILETQTIEYARKHTTLCLALSFQDQ